jgi:hydroxypyruvate isomerase
MKKSNRREALKKIATGAFAAGSISALSAQSSNPASISASNSPSDTFKMKGNINHSVCRWTYNSMTVEELCVTVKKLGFSAIDLVGPKDWPILKQHGVDSSMCNGAEISLTEGWNDKQYHARLIKNYTDHIELVSKAGYKNLICFSGNRRGMDDKVGMENCAEGIKQIMKLAESKGVMIQMELLNSKVNHKDYMCDLSKWGIELSKKINSPNFKLLYDIYHMQIDEGDVIRTIKDNHQYFGHYHTGGVPGRNIIDESQELYYPAIMKAIVATGFKGYTAQEFLPLAETPSGKIAELKKAVRICDV